LREGSARQWHKNISIQVNEAFKAQIAPKVDEATLSVPHPLTDGDTAEGALVPVIQDK
jgi:hypothetical protein